MLPSGAGAVAGCRCGPHRVLPSLPPAPPPPRPTAPWPRHWVSSNQASRYKYYTYIFSQNGNLLLL